MDLDPIRERLSNGFEPFVLVTTDGRRFEVPHHDFIAVGKNVVVVVNHTRVHRVHGEMRSVDSTRVAFFRSAAGFTKDHSLWTIR